MLGSKCGKLNVEVLTYTLLGSKWSKAESGGTADQQQHADAAGGGEDGDYQAQ